MSMFKPLAVAVVIFVAIRMYVESIFLTAAKVRVFFFGWLR